MIWLLCVWRVRQRKIPQPTPGIIYISLALAAVLLIAIAGHLGGIFSGVESGATCKKAQINANVAKILNIYLYLGLLLLVRTPVLRPAYL